MTSAGTLIRTYRGRIVGGEGKKYAQGERKAGEKTKDGLTKSNEPFSLCRVGWGGGIK